LNARAQNCGHLASWKLTGAIKTAERKLADGSLRHSGQELMSWAVANARVEPKRNAIIITKQASGSAKIDPLMAAFNAIAPMSTNPWSTRPSIFVIEAKWIRRPEVRYSSESGETGP
jgi:phage terminase large subunit-like protein